MTIREERERRWATCCLAGPPPPSPQPPVRSGSRGSNSTARWLPRAQGTWGGGRMGSQDNPAGQGKAGNLPARCPTLGW